MATFGWSEDYVCEEISGAKGWAFYVWAVENRASMAGGDFQRSTPGYVAQQIKRLKAKK